MQRTLRITTISAIWTLLALSSFAQDRPGWRTASDIGEGGRGVISGTVVDIDEGRNRLQLEAEEDRSRVTVEADSLTTQFNGFGGLIAGKPEIFIGSRGFSNVRVGDRLDVRGVGRGRGTVVADTITLRGRTVAAPQVGVGETRTPGNVSTQIDDRVGANETDAPTTAEGTIRQINAEQGRIVIQTPQRRMITVRATRTTPVWYRGEQFRIASLEVGDRIRIDADPRTAQADDVYARRIDVVQSVQDATGANPNQAGVVALLSGRVTRIDPGLDYAYLDTGRETEMRVDMTNATDALGDRISARDLRINDRVEISGNYNRTGDLFVASTVRHGSGNVDTTRPVPSTPMPGQDELGRFAVVTITGTVTETLEDSATLGVRDRDTNRILRIWATEDLVTRLKSNTTYQTATQLRVNDSVVIKAYRDGAGNLIAQTVRVRNR
ncbi:MAG TPA: hypothetical protein VGF48_19785 [Thermoanaerobaculia bacterium]|jgi:hypothetical protein